MRRVALALAVAFPLAAGAGPIPTYQSKATSLTGGTGTCTPSTTGASWQAGDILLVVASSENESISLSTANSFAEVGTQANQAAGTAATDPGQRLAVYWKRATATNDSMPVIADSGNNTECQLYTFRGAIDSGNPWDVIASGNNSGSSIANNSNLTIPSVTTTVTNTLIVLITGHSQNATQTTNCGTVTNANLGSLTERGDATNTAGLGGGHCLFTGTSASTQTIGSTTVVNTGGSATYAGALTIALKPQTTFNESFTEAVTAADSLTHAWTHGESFTEAVTLGDSATSNDPRALNISSLGSNTATSTNTVSLTNVSTSGASLIIVSVHIGAGNDTQNLNASNVSSVTVGGNAATFRGYSNQVNTGTTDQCVEFWTYASTGALSNATITATTVDASVTDLGIGVLSATGHNGTGNTGANSQNGSTATVSVTASANDSVMVGAVSSRDGGWVAGTNTSILETLNTASYGFNVAKNTQTTTNGNSYTLTETSTGWFWSFLGLEILKATGTTYAESFTEAVTAAESLAAPAGTYGVSFTDAVTAGDSLSASGSTYSTSFTEAVTAGDSLTAGLVYANPFTEAVTAGDSLANAATFGQSYSESVTASDSLSASGSTYSTSFTDSVTVADSLADPTGTYSTSVTEAVTLTDSMVDDLIPGGGTTPSNSGMSGFWGSVDFEILSEHRRHQT